MQIVISLRRNYLTECRDDVATIRRLPRAIVVGARGKYEVVDTADMEELAGIAFQPGGFPGLFRERADLFFERSVALGDVWAQPQIVERLSEGATPGEKLKTLEDLLARRAGEAHRSRLVDQALHLFRENGSSVAACARSVGVSERRLFQVFREEVGVTPKLWCRIGRFQGAVRALHAGTQVPWADLALACGYYDQAHFANDFRAFSGINPTTYSAQRGRWQNHVPMA